MNIHYSEPLNFALSGVLRPLRGGAPPSLKTPDLYIKSTMFFVCLFVCLCVCPELIGKTISSRNLKICMHV